MPNNFSVNCLGIAAFTMMTTAAAQIADSPTPASPVQAPHTAPAPVATVEIKGSTETVRQNDTASRIVVTREELLKYGDRSVLEAMKRLPGVTVTDSTVRMRGLGNGYTQVLVNGERAPAGFSMETLAPDSVEKIEILRSATAEYSTQSIAGTVNVILRKAVTTKSGEVKVSIGRSPGVTAPAVNLSLSDKTAKYNYTLGASFSHSDGTTSSSGLDRAKTAANVETQLRPTSTRSHNVSTSGNVNSRVNWTLGGRDALTWQTFLNAGRFHGTADNSTATLAGPAYPYPDLQVRFDGDNTSLRSDINLVKRFAGGAKIDTKAGLYTAHTDRVMHRRGRRGADLVLDRSYATDILDRGLTTTGKYSVPLIAEHAFAFGWEAGRSKFDQQDIQVDQAFESSPALNFNNSFDATVTRLALYAQDEWDIRSGWSMYLGARWEGMRTSTTGSGFSATSSRYSIFSPLMQTLWKIPGTKSDQLRLALTRTYRAPQLSRLVQRHFYTTFNTAVSPDFVGNPTLRPELATGIDMAYERYFNAGGLISLSATSREISDFIRNTVVFDGARWVSLPTNQGRARVRSIELETKFPLKAIGSNWPVTTRASVSRNWSSVDEVPGPENRLDRQPKWSASLGADYVKGPVSAGAAFSYVSGGWTRTSVFESNFSSPKRDFETYLLYKFDPSRQLRFIALNLLAPSTINTSHYTDAGGQLESSTSNPSYRGWRLQYEQKFQ